MGVGGQCMWRKGEQGENLKSGISPETKRLPDPKGFKLCLKTVKHKMQCSHQIATNKDAHSVLNNDNGLSSVTCLASHTV